MLRSVTEIAMAIVGIAGIALLVNRADDAAKLITASGNTFNMLLNTVTLQNGYGNFAMQGRY